MAKYLDSAQEAFKWAKAQPVWEYCAKSISNLRARAYIDESAAFDLLLNNAKDIEIAYRRAGKGQLSLGARYDVARLLRAECDKECAHSRQERQQDEYFCLDCGARWEA